MSRKYFFVVVVSVWGSWAITAHADVTLPLQYVRSEVLGRNPKIQAAGDRASAFKSTASAERALPAPELMYERWGLGGGVPAEENWYGITQKIPFPTKLSNRFRSKDHEARAESFHAAAMTREMVARAEQAYFELFYLISVIPVVTENADLFRRFLHSGEAKYATGEISQIDFLRAQTELSKLLNQLTTLEQEKTSAAVSLNVLMNHSFDAPLGVPEPPQLIPLPPAEKLEKEALNSRPEVLATEHHIEHLRANRSVARLEYVPDFTVRYAYRTRPSFENDSTIAVGIELPFLWFNRPRNLNKAADSELSEAQSNFEAMQLETREAVRKAWTEALAARRRVELTQTTWLPQARQTRNTAEKAYATRQLRFLEFLDTQRTYLEAQVDYYDALKSFGQRVSDLERLLGKNLSEVSREN